MHTPLEEHRDDGRLWRGDSTVRSALGVRCLGGTGTGAGVTVGIGDTQLISSRGKTDSYMGSFSSLPHSSGCSSLMGESMGGGGGGSVGSGKDGKPNLGGVTCCSIASPSNSC